MSLNYTQSKDMYLSTFIKFDEYISSIVACVSKEGRFSKVLNGC